MLSRHTVEVRFKGNSARWVEATGATALVRSSNGWRGILARLGYGLEPFRPMGMWLAMRAGLVRV